MIGKKKAHSLDRGTAFQKHAALCLVSGRVLPDGDLVNADVAGSSMQPK
jgi:hypothetical protein